MVNAYESKPTNVTLYEDRAEVTRECQAELKEGLQWISVSGISPFVFDRSVRASVVGDDAELVSVRVVRKIHYSNPFDEDELNSIEAQLEQARALVERQNQRVERAEKRRGRTLELFDQWISAISEIPTNPGAEHLDSWKTSFDELQDSGDEVLKRRIDSMKDVELANRELNNAEARYSESRAITPVCRAVIEVQIKAKAVCSSKIELTYRVPCAMWRPEHLARLTGEGKAELITWATAWQRTGEKWDNVLISFSTARPAQAASAPTLEDDIIWSRKKSYEERKHVVVNTWEQSVSSTGEDGTREVDEMPGVDDGGEPLVFHAPKPLTLGSTGKPFQVEVERRTLDCKVERVMTPEISDVAHLKGSLVLSGRPLLAGPVRVARDQGMVGRSRIEFVAPGEPFCVGFGPDDALRVTRKTYETRDKVPVIGTQLLDRTIELFISNLSGETKELKLTERVLVSEVEQVEVRLREYENWEFNWEDGFLTRCISVGPRSTAKCSYRYEVRADSKVRLPF